MKFILLAIFIATIIYPLCSLRYDKTALYQMPCLISITTLAFILPSIALNTANHELFTDASYSIYVSNAILCMLGAYLGYHFGQSPDIDRIKSDNTYDRNKVIFYTSIFFLIGVFFSLQINPFELGGITEGFAVIKITLGRLIRPASIILIFCFLKKKNYWLVFLLLLWLFVTMRFVIISGRRSEVFIFFISLLLPLFFMRNLILSKLRYIIIGVLFGMSVFIVLPVVREFTKQQEYMKVQNINVIELFDTYFSGDKTNEVAEAAFNVEVIYKENGYNYGASFYNSFVNQFVSSTLFGKDAKKKALIDVTSIKELRGRHYNPHLGPFKFYLTPTGYADSFYAFGFFAFFLYGIFGYITRRIYDKAIYSGDVMDQIFYSFYVIMIFNSVYESISHIPVLLVMYLVVFLPVKYLSRI